MKQNHRLFMLAALVGITVLTGCSRKEPASPPNAAKPTSGRTGDAPTSGARKLTPPPGEPPEDVIIRIKKSEYDAINAAGGMPVTVTASGRSTVLKPKIWSAKKVEPCRLQPRGPEGEYECSLDMMVTFREGDNKPSKHSERVAVYWDGVAGKWKGNLPGRK